MASHPAHHVIGNLLSLYAAVSFVIHSVVPPGTVAPPWTDLLPLYQDFDNDLVGLVSTSGISLQEKGIYMEIILVIRMASSSGSLPNPFQAFIQETIRKLLATFPPTEHKRYSQRIHPVDGVTVIVSSPSMGDIARSGGVPTSHYDYYIVRTLPGLPRPSSTQAQSQTAGASSSSSAAVTTEPIASSSSAAATGETTGPSVPSSTTATRELTGPSGDISSNDSDEDPGEEDPQSTAEE